MTGPGGAFKIPKQMFNLSPPSPIDATNIVPVKSLTLYTFYHRPRTTVIRHDNNELYGFCFVCFRVSIIMHVCNMYTVYIVLYAIPVYVNRREYVNYYTTNLNTSLCVHVFSVKSFQLRILLGLVLVTQLHNSKPFPRHIIIR